MSNYCKIIAFVCLLTASLALLNLKHYANVPGHNAQAIDIVIARGSSIKQIGKELAKHGIIKHPKLFMAIKKLFFPSAILKAGEYEIAAFSSISEVINMMNNGLVVIHKFTILEGSTTKEVVDKVLNEPCLSGKVNIDFKEGDFLSDTYYFTYGETKLALLTRIFNASQALLEELWQERAENLPINTKQEAMILASIVEKETGISSERPRIAGVFLNRLHKKMKLQADPTVIYAVTMGQYTLLRPLTLADLRLDSPYNSYLYLGLPPSAIAIPGKAALNATLHPVMSNELYFVADGKGGHNFSATLQEHNSHVKNYRQINQP